MSLFRTELVSVVVGYRIVALLSPLGLSESAGRARPYIEVVLLKISIRTPHGYIGLAIAVVITLRRESRSRKAPGSEVRRICRCRALANVPINVASSAADNSDIRLAVAVIVAGDDHVGRKAEVVRADGSRTICVHPVHSLRASAALDHKVGHAVTVKVARCRVIAE